MRFSSFAACFAAIPLMTFCLALHPWAALAQADAPSTKTEEVDPESGVRVTTIERSGEVERTTYDASGKMLSKDSTRYGTTTYVYDPSRNEGPYARMWGKRHESERGIWRRHMVYDEKGDLAMNLDVSEDERGWISFIDALQPFLWPRGIHVQTLDDLRPIQTDDFASIQVDYLEGGVVVQQSVVLGRDMEIRTEPLDEDRKRIYDSEGGERIETWDGRALLAARDAVGPLLEAHLDVFERPERIVVGGILELGFSYQGGDRLWSERSVTDLETGKQIGTWKRANDFEDIADAPLPRQRALALQPSSIPVAEWDHELAPSGNILFTRFGEPYALFPFEGKGEMWRSLTTSFRSIVAHDRIDYTDSEIRVYLTLGPASIAAHSEVLLVFERERLMTPPPVFGEGP